mmetsp:Transcript_91068/g.294074  ORF Transcript_91068/g.294074 Transcript_91068/m.294074 type:complete len:219 (-) Transcript_91068:7-663(-)
MNCAYSEAAAFSDASVSACSLLWLNGCSGQVLRVPDGCSNLEVGFGSGLLLQLVDERLDHADDFGERGAGGGHRRDQSVQRVRAQRPCAAAEQRERLLVDGVGEVQLGEAELMSLVRPAASTSESSPGNLSSKLFNNSTKPGSQSPASWTRRGPKRRMRRRSSAPPPPYSSSLASGGQHQGIPARQQRGHSERGQAKHGLLHCSAAAIHERRGARQRG